MDYKINSNDYQDKVTEIFCIIDEFDKNFGRVNQQVQYYEINLKNSFFGVEKLSFSLGLRLILY